MAQLERPQRQVDTPKNPIIQTMEQLERPQIPLDGPRTPTIHSMEQLLRAGDSSKLSPKGSKPSPLSSKLSPKFSKQSPTNSSSMSATSSPSSPASPFFQKLRHHDSEEDHGQNQKKSVLSKVKEKAKKLRHSLSKKKHEDGNLTPSSGAPSEDYGEQDDAEYNGAPMYKSEKAPEGYKEDERQQPKVHPIICEKNASSSNDKLGSEHDQERSLSRSLSKRISHPATAIAAATTTNTTIDAGLNKTMNKTVTEKLTPANKAERSDAVLSIASKVHGLSVPKHGEHHHASSSSSSPKGAVHNSALSSAVPSTPPAKTPIKTAFTATRTSSAPVTPRASSAPLTPQTLSCSSAPAPGKFNSPTAQLWDKGVSVKEYLMNKLEPGEDEKALSQVISEAMSPKRTPGDVGVIEKVREAVTSLLRNEEPKKPADTTTTTTTAGTSSQTLLSTNASQIPVSTNAQEVVQEENHGRILQAN